MENGDTFSANAIIKAEAALNFTGAMALADDSGLEVDALQGAPGVHSARYAGPDASSADRNNKLLSALSAVSWSQRSARFVCAVALARPNAPTWVALGVHEGYILNEPHGNSGFGYDPIFYSTELGASFAEVPMEVKNRVSHRGRALLLLKEHLKELARRC